jgi:putative DNA primase/helicase
MTTTRPRQRDRRPEITDSGDLVTDYAYLAGLVELIDNGSIDDAKKWHSAIPTASLCDADAVAVHRGIGEALTSENPSVASIGAAVRRCSDGNSIKVVEIYQRVLKQTKNPKTCGAYLAGLTGRVHEIEEREARRAGFELLQKFGDALEDRSVGAEAFAGLRRVLDDVESIMLRQPGRRDEIGFVTMDKVDPKPMAWLWPQRLVSNGLNVVTGLMGQTKGLFMVDVAAKITRGWRWPDNSGHAPEGSVLWIGSEDDPATVLRPRLDAAGADVSKVAYLQGVRTSADDDDFRPLSIGQDLRKIAAALDRLPDCRMIVLDPVTEFMEADDNASKEIRAELMPFVKMAAARGIALVVVCHQNKKQGLSTLQRIAGGGAFGQIARTTLVFTEDPSGEESDDLRRRRLMIVAKMSGGRKNIGQAYRLRIPDGHATPSIHWIAGEINMDADEIGFKPSGGRDHQDKIGDAVDELTHILRNGPTKAIDAQSAMEGAGFKRRQIDAAAAKLGVLKTQQAGGWTWAMPAEEPIGEPRATGRFTEFDAFDPGNGWTNTGFDQ